MYAGKAAGKAVKSVNKFCGKFMRNINGKGESPSGVEQSSFSGHLNKYESSRQSMDENEMGPSDEDLDQLEGDGKSGEKGQPSLTHVIAGHNNTVWVAWSTGRIERYGFNGRLEFRKAR